MQCIWELDPRNEATYSAGNVQDNEGQSCPLCIEREDKEGTPAVLFRTNRALPLLAELWGTIFKSNHLVC